jgi:hypothetical protein
MQPKFKFKLLTSSLSEWTSDLSAIFCASSEKTTFVLASTSFDGDTGMDPTPAGGKFRNHKITFV